MASLCIVQYGPKLKGINGKMRWSKIIVCSQKYFTAHVPTLFFESIKGTLYHKRINKVYQRNKILQIKLNYKTKKKRYKIIIAQFKLQKRITIHTLAAATSASITRLARMVSEDLNQQFVLALLELINDSVVERVLVLLKPAGDVVADLFSG